MKLSMCLPIQKVYQLVLTVTPYASTEQDVSTKDISCQRGLTLCQTPPIQGRTQNSSSRIDQTPPLPALTQYSSHIELTKHLPCQWRHKIWPNMCYPNLSHASEDSQCIARCVEQTHRMPGRTQNISQLELIKPLSCKLGQKMHLNLSWPNLSHAVEDRKYISSWVNQTSHIPVRTQYVC